MAPLRICWALALPTALASIGAAAAQERAYQCERSGVQRSITVEYQDPEQRVPCEVVYRKPPEAPEVLWSARSEAGFCESKAQELVGTLEQAGWACTGSEERPPATARPPAPEPDPQEAPAPDANGTAEQAPPPASDVPALQAVVARDLERLDQSTEAKVVADSTAYGDLNGDGELDAAVLITFDADGADYVQYLVAYLFEDDDYRPVASRMIGGRYREVYGGEVDKIQDGAILLDLQILQPGDPSCCPSGTRQSVIVLKDGELVKIEEDPAAAAARLKEEP